MGTAAETGEVRRGEIVAALSLATDLALGQPMEFAQQSCILADRIGRRIGAQRDQLAEIHHQSLLRYIGCNAETHAMAALFGDEIDFRRDFARIDPGRASEMGALIFAYLRRANADAGAMAALGAVVRGMIASKAASVEILSSHCEVAERLAERLGFPPSVRRNLGQLYERWDGKGLPRGLKGEAIAPAVRIVSFSQDEIVLRAAFGADGAKERIRARRGSAYEPQLVDLYLARAGELVAGLESVTWNEVQALSPDPDQPMSAAEFDEACLAIADFADLKSPWSVGHSRAVAALARDAAIRCGLPATDARDLYRAGLLHDIGQVAVPLRVWAKPAAFNDADREQARMHPYFGERVLARPQSLARLANLVAQHHERSDGSGYHQGLRGSALSAPSRLLSAAEAYQNKIEARPHRAALSPSAAADALKREARDGRLDPDAVAAVLAAAGHSVAPRRTLVADLTPREIEVLRAIARGQSTKEIARTLGVSPKTVDNQTQAIYAKLSVRTRGGATLFAIEHGLC